ncbi:hypothetical protein IMZ48_15500 [Candidatus Bathyarchaeota archaeon]|nr:hypothetical protein [Candidatus Bathyarchaeota archaeon]
MAELVGTAVGVISLGIQVCKGLVTYCRAVKGQNKDVDDVFRQIQALQSTFTALNSILPRAALLKSPNQTAIASVVTCLDNCEEGVNDLQRLLDSIGPVPGGGGDVKGKMKDVGRKLAFGFRQGEVASLMQKLQGLTASAELALQTLAL